MTSSLASLRLPLILPFAPGSLYSVPFVVQLSIPAGIVPTTYSLSLFYLTVLQSAAELLAVELVVLVEAQVCRNRSLGGQDGLPTLNVKSLWHQIFGN